MEKMLDAGFCLPAIGFAFCRGGREYWIFKGNYLFLSSIQYPVSWVLWDKRSSSAVGSKFRVQGSRLKTDIILNPTWNVEL
jgi:hypothetical protein